MFLSLRAAMESCLIWSESLSLLSDQGIAALAQIGSLIGSWLLSLEILWYDIPFNSILTVYRKYKKIIIL
jgi:hypothetical protein